MKKLTQSIYGTGMAVAIAAVLTLGMVSCGGSSEGSSENSEQVTEEVIEFVECKAGDLLKEQKDNSARAKKAYEDKYLQVEGVVSAIADNGEYFEITGGEDFAVNSIKCDVETDELKDQILELNKGQKVTVKGKCTDVSGGFRTYAIDVTEIVK